VLWKSIRLDTDELIKFYETVTLSDSYMVTVKVLEVGTPVVRLHAGLNISKNDFT